VVVGNMPKGGPVGLKWGIRSRAGRERRCDFFWAGQNPKLRDAIRPLLKYCRLSYILWEGEGGFVDTPVR
jgi:hypothetical protein